MALRHLTTVVSMPHDAAADAACDSTNADEFTAAARCQPMELAHGRPDRETVFRGTFPGLAEPQVAGGTGRTLVCGETVPGPAGLEGAQISSRPGGSNTGLQTDRGHVSPHSRVSHSEGPRSEGFHPGGSDQWGAAPGPQTDSSRNESGDDAARTDTITRGGALSADEYSSDDDDDDCDSGVCEDDQTEKNSWSSSDQAMSAAQHNLRTRINRRPVREKIRQKRQALQSMARPLKRWLCTRREHPYPTRAEKASLARVAGMSVVQVSNWFANARRRLKNTVRGGELSWAIRISLYNSHVCGNQELLTDDDSLCDVTEASVGGGATSARRDALPAGRPDVTTSLGSSASAAAAAPPSKYKHVILQRYLSDACAHSTHVCVLSTPGPTTEGLQRHRNLSGSLSSHDYEDVTSSARSTPTREHQLVEDQCDDSYEEIAKQRLAIDSRLDDDLYWKEISAALALTNLARSRFRPAVPSVR